MEFFYCFPIKENDGVRWKEVKQIGRLTKDDTDRDIENREKTSGSEVTEELVRVL